MMFFGLLVAASALALSHSAPTHEHLADRLPHYKSGDYIDQVQGKPYSEYHSACFTCDLNVLFIAACRPEIAFVVDTSPSIGRRTADTFIVPLLSNFENELRRLPNAPGDGSQGSNLHLVTFNKAAVAITLNSIGASYNSIMKTAQKAIKNAPITGGTCLSCGIEAATKILQEKGL